MSDNNKQNVVLDYRIEEIKLLVIALLNRLEEMGKL